MLPVLYVPDDNLPETATDAMLPNMQDFLDDVFLPPDIKTGRTVNKFAPKVRGKTKKPLTATTKTSDTPYPITFNAKQEISMTDQGNSGQDADILLGMESLDNCVRASSATVRAVSSFSPKDTPQLRGEKLVKADSASECTESVVLIPMSNVGSSELNIVEEPAHVMKEVVVHTEDHQDGAHVLGEPEADKEVPKCGSHSSDRDSSLHGDPAKAVLEVSRDALSEATTDVMLPNPTDFLDDVFLPLATTIERSVKKFQPKLLGKTKKTITATSKPCDAPQLSTFNAKLEVSTTEGNLEQGADISFGIEALDDHVQTAFATGTAETISASYLRSSGSAPMDCSSQVNETHEPSNVTMELLTHEVACQSGREASESERSLQPDPKKSEHDAMPEEEYLDDILMLPSDISEVKQVSKFQPKSGSRPKGRKAKSVSFSLPDAAETATPPVRPLCEVLANDLEGAEPSFTQTMNGELADRTSHSTSTISDNVDFQSDHGSLRIVDLADLPGLQSFDSILSEPAPATGKTVPKFRSKMSTKPKTAKPDSFSNSNVAQQSTSLGGSLPSDTEQIEGHNLCIPAVSSTNIVNEQANPVEMSSFEVGSPGGDDEFETIDITMDRDTSNEVPSWNDEEQTQQILDDQITSKSFKGHGADKSSRKLRKRIAVDSTSENIDCEISENWDVENSKDLQMDEDHNNDEYKGEDVIKQEPKRSKRQMTDGQKPKRRKKASKEPDSTKTEPPKKRFPHGTRRKRRQVDKVLLETPDDELDRRQLAFRDLIMLAEAKERISGKEAANLNDIHSNAGSFSNGSRFEPDNPYDEDLDPDGEEAHRNMLRNSRKLNYQTYMNKPKSGRWSKSETVLFYEAIRQFGTDFEMIVQLFPNRTRSQVKSKFKTEERKHPTEVRDAMIHRSEDHSHFERVIQQLQTQAEDSMLDNANDDPAMVSGDAANANQEERDQTSKEELGEAANTEKCDEWDDDCASLDLNEYESCDWDAGTSSFQNEEKYSEYDEFS